MKFRNQIWVKFDSEAQYVQKRYKKLKKSQENERNCLYYQIRQAVIVKNLEQASIEKPLTRNIQRKTDKS